MIPQVPQRNAATVPLNVSVSRSCPAWRRTARRSVPSPSIGEKWQTISRPRRRAVSRSTVARGCGGYEHMAFVVQPILRSLRQCRRNNVEPATLSRNSAKIASIGSGSAKLSSRRRVTTEARLRPSSVASSWRASRIFPVMRKLSGELRFSCAGLQGLPRFMPLLMLRGLAARYPSSFQAHQRRGERRGQACPPFSRAQ